MMCINNLDISKHRVWKDRNIKPEAKEIFAYLYSEAFDRTISHISIGKVQRQIKSIKNVGFKKNLQLLEKNNYIKFIEYDTGLYEYTIC
ncbi:MAG: hypothetical protein K2M17_06095 [Bacilli bacterium]|nr:hypothetical protein [Bacilli bacterium]